MTCTFQSDSPNPKIYVTVPHSSLAPSVNCKHNDMTPFSAFFDMDSLLIDSERVGLWAFEQACLTRILRSARLFFPP
jgi:hypothetical protein